MTYVHFAESEGLRVGSAFRSELVLSLGGASALAALVLSMIFIAWWAFVGTMAAGSALSFALMFVLRSWAQTTSVLLWLTSILTLLWMPFAV
ncbi:hypothetical protein ACFJIW_20445 [Tahibacter sp. UC22_41]|uniref:hypothetical protein n=1 Tax=Tahibacter sp. UC22_41 TaxID=3350178 RepID=UPI0036DB4D07